MVALARVVVGCYEEMVVCYDLVRAEDETNDESAAEDVNNSVNGQQIECASPSETSSDAPTKFQLKLSFTDHPHSGSVRCIAASKGGMIASGSNDETIHVYNANTGRDVGSLMSHGGSVTSLQFHGAKYLVSGSEDANVVIWKTKPSWDVLKTLRGHKGPVECVSVHPSGKIALSTGKDRTLKTWNLIKGRSAYVTNIKQEGSIVHWSPTGKYYAIVSGACCLRVYDVATAKVVFSLDHKSRINAFRFLGHWEGGGGAAAVEDDLFVCGGEGKEMFVGSVSEAKVLASFDVHETRLRDLVVIDTPEELKSEAKEKWIATGSNDGWIKMWKLKRTESTFENELVCEVNAGVRITCMCSYTKQKPPTKSKEQKSGGKLVEEMDEGEEEEEMTDKKEVETSKRTTDDAKETERKSSKKVKFS